MSHSYTATESTTFTVTNARHIAAKVATDLKRMQRFYGSPSDIKIAEYEEEVIQLLKHGYLSSVTFGFKRDACWIEPTLRYSASELTDGIDDDPGRIRPNKDISGAIFYSFLSYSSSWFSLTEEEMNKFKDNLPFWRTSATQPEINGYLDHDRSYSSGGKSLSRSSVRSY
ncbi:hypothetical protein ACJJID_08630 [Microbulbifer sp. CnH-101-G]|uniref:HORMA-1 domain-containing protein n=1 Tax=Microbulbifer sp. CnH-101-G TaxID=3243393 RepID=UPI00403922FE